MKKKPALRQLSRPAPPPLPVAPAAAHLSPDILLRLFAGRGLAM